MKISTLLRFLSCAFVATALSLTALGQTELGRIKAARVQGDVQKITNAGDATALKDGDEVVQTDSISTGKGASVVLVFANGSSVRLGAESRLRIDEFLMDPLDAPLTNPGALKEEPTKSKTTLNLSYGEMVGDVKKLNTAAGSTYSIKTPVGAAGIRGTIYRIVFRPSSDGKAFFQIQTAEGLVVMEGVVNLSDVSVAEGTEVVVEIDTSKSGPPEVKTSEISQTDVAIIRGAAQELVQTLQNTTIDNTPPTPPQEEKTEEPLPPPPVKTDPILTPDTGKS